MFQMLLLLAGDVELCPGPSCHSALSCKTCLKTIRKNQSREMCSVCEGICHLKCLKDRFENGVEKLYCPNVCYLSEVEAEGLPPGVDNNQSFPNLNNLVGKRGLKIFHQNINGLLTKVDKIKVFMQDSRNYIQILGVTESHCNSSILNDQLTDTKSYEKIKVKERVGEFCVIYEMT